MNDVEVSPRFPLDFSQKDFFRREVEILYWKCPHKGLNVMRTERNHNIYIQRESWAAIGNCSEPADDTIGNPRIFELAQNKVNFLHSQ